MNIKIVFLMLFFLSSSIIAMESPFKGNKRMARALEDEDASLQSSQEEKSESKKNYIQLQHQLFNVATQLADVPTEIQENIIKFILNANGPTQRARLYNATENLRKFSCVNQAYHDWLQDPRLVKIIIQELAQLYANGNVVEAVIAWGVPVASRYLANEINNAIELKDGNEFDIVNSNYASELINRFNAQITLSLINKDQDIYDFLTHAIVPNKLSWMLNRLLLAGVSPLTFAILQRMPNIITSMINLPDIDYGNDPELVDLVPLHAAVSTENSVLVHMLLQKKPDSINARDMYENTPLILAVEKKNKEIVELLLTWNAQINVLNAEGVSPLIAAVKNNDIPIVQRLLAEGNIDPNLQAAPPNFATVKPSALDIAITKQNVQIVELLLLHTRTNINREDGVDAPIHIATSNGDISVLRMLLRFGAQVNARSASNMTPIMFAAINDKIDVIKELINAGAALNLRDNENNSALSFAQEVGNPIVIDSLIKAGAIE